MDEKYNFNRLNLFIRWSIGILMFVSLIASLNIEQRHTVFTVSCWLIVIYLIIVIFVVWINAIFILSQYKPQDKYGNKRYSISKCLRLCGDPLLKLSSIFGILMTSLSILCNDEVDMSYVIPAFRLMDFILWASSEGMMLYSKSQFIQYSKNNSL